MSALRVRTRRTLTEKDAATYLRVGVTALDIVRLRWPLVSGIHDIADAVAVIERAT